MGLRAQEILISAWKLKIGGEKKKARQNNRPILVITDSGELALKVCFLKSKFGVKSLKVKCLVSGPLEFFNISVSGGNVANVAAFLFSFWTKSKE